MAKRRSLVKVETLGFAEQFVIDNGQAAEVTITLSALFGREDVNKFLASFGTTNTVQIDKKRQCFCQVGFDLELVEEDADLVEARKAQDIFLLVADEFFVVFLGAVNEMLHHGKAVCSIQKGLPIIFVEESEGGEPSGNLLKIGVAELDSRMIVDFM